MRQNVVRDTIAELLQKVCKDVRIEPRLLPVTGEELSARTNVAEGARADVSAIGLWQPLNRAFLDIKVFNPLAVSNAAKDMQKIYKKHKQDKKAHVIIRDGICMLRFLTTTTEWIRLKFSRISYNCKCLIT